MNDELTSFLDNIRSKGIQRNSVKQVLTETPKVDKNGNDMKVVKTMKVQDMPKPILKSVPATPAIAETVRPRNYKNVPPALLDLFDKLIDFVEYNGTRVIGQLSNFLEHFEASAGGNYVPEARMGTPNMPMSGMASTLAVPGVGNVQVRGTQQERMKGLMEQITQMEGNKTPASSMNFNNPPPLELPEINIEKLNKLPAAGN